MLFRGRVLRSLVAARCSLPAVQRIPLIAHRSLFHRYGTTVPVSRVDRRHGRSCVLVARFRTAAVRVGPPSLWLCTATRSCSSVVVASQPGRQLSVDRCFLATDGAPAHLAEVPVPTKNAVGAWVSDVYPLRHIAPLIDGFRWVLRRFGRDFTWHEGKAATVMARCS